MTSKKPDGKSAAAKDTPGMERNSAGFRAVDDGIELYGDQIVIERGSVGGGGLDTGPLDALLTEIGGVPDELDSLSLVNAKREATFKLSTAINALKVLRKLSA